ncbi:MAG: hypothetical protein ABSC02_06110 [Acidobacteriota bacterium]|jgi:hypothetical protein
MNPSSNAQATLYRLRFAPPTAQGGPIVFTFSDPTPWQAVGEAEYLSAPPTSAAFPVNERIDILVLPSSLKDDSRWLEGARAWLTQPDQPEAFSVQAGGIQVSWRPGQAVIVAPPAQALAALEAVVDFAYYENELRKIEKEIAGAWPAVEADTPLAYNTVVSDLSRDKETGQRVHQLFQNRMRHARIEPHLIRPPARFSRPARDLSEGLREAALCKERAETADGQVEVQEHVYEMASQRLGEFRHARQGFILETIIIVLLAVEVILMIIEIL